MAKKKLPVTGEKSLGGKPRLDEAVTAAQADTANPLAAGTTRRKARSPTPTTLLATETMTGVFSASTVGPPTVELKEKFSAQKIPLQTDFADLIDVADCGRMAMGLSPAQPGGTGGGLQLDAQVRLAVQAKHDGAIAVGSDGLEVVVDGDKGLAVGTKGVSIKAGDGIKIDPRGVCVDFARVLPVGMVMMFSGTTIPPGWRACDGSNGTPDLRNRFILGGSAAELNGKSAATATGSLTTKTYTATTSTIAPTIRVTVDNTTLTQDQMPNHSHISPRSCMTSPTMPLPILMAR